ncbi:MAG: GntR family transcriptional regulator [Acidimicrobiaceae bacterium]|nr:GntR family transcriptional regulator [Acidimicrobiaceae bacterium]MYG56474.1 GntR family transcriptional regulator [Acidimicrobiaceae bacterium]MYJ97650.1 GntR family transcriptional regulator [Acidimicrobiaceae bacterium]
MRRRACRARRPIRRHGAGPVNEVVPLERIATSERVAEEVRRLIWTGDLAAGDRLNQDEIAHLFGVSRIPVREALITLAHAGVVTMTLHRGAFVVPLTAEAVRDHYELYALVDGFALGKTVERDGDLDALAEDFRSAARSADDEELFTKVIAARRRLHGLGGSPRFDAVAGGLVGLVPGNFFAEVPGTGEVARCRLPLVADALAQRRTDDAVVAYSSMLREQGRLVVRVLAANGALVKDDAP